MSDGGERKAMGELVLSAVCFGAMAFATRLAARGGLGGAQIAALRFAIGLAPLAWPGIARRALAWTRWDLLLYRGLFGGSAVLLYFLAIAHVPVGLATLLNYMSPIYAGIFAALFIGERAGLRVVLPLTVALAGVALVVREQAGPEGLLAVGPWVLVGLASSVLSGAAVTAIRVARRTEGSWAVYASFCALGLLVTAPFAAADWTTPRGWQWVEVAAVGILSLAAQLLMTHAYRWIDNVRAGVVQQLAVFVAMGLGALALDEAVTPTMLFGALLTVAAVSAVILARGRATARPTAGSEVASRP